MYNDINCIKSNFAEKKLINIPNLKPLENGHEVPVYEFLFTENKV